MLTLCRSRQPSRCRWLLPFLPSLARSKQPTPCPAALRPPCIYATATAVLPPTHMCTHSYKHYLQLAVHELRSIRSGPGGVQLFNLSPAWCAGHTKRHMMHAHSRLLADAEGGGGCDVASSRRAS